MWHPHLNTRLRRAVTAAAIALCSAGASGAQAAAGSPPAARFVAVERDVSLEVLDWGGTGRPVVLLAGLGNDAHVFDAFARRLTPDYHVYGITRRGFGESSVPASGYLADRLGDDVLAVLDSLRLDRPVLIGHSLAGEELSSVGSRHPERVAGLVYLDAANAYAYYDAARGDFGVDLAELQRKLDRLWPTSGIGSRATSQLIQDLLNVELPALEKNLRNAQKMLAMGPEQPPAAVSSPMLATAHAIMAGEQRYTDIHVPVLAIYALPRQFPPLPVDSATRRSMLAADSAATAAQADAFERGVPSARVGGFRTRATRFSCRTRATFFVNCVRSSLAFR